MRLHRVVLAAMVAGVIATGTLGSAAAGGSGPWVSFDLRIGDGCVAGQGRPNTGHLVSLYTSTGRLKDRNRVVSTGRDFVACFFQPILGGDRLVAEAARLRRSFRVPQLMPNIDRVRDVVTGSARPGATVDLTLLHGEGFALAQPYDRQVRADASGAYAADFSDIGIVGADQVEATWTNGHDRVGAMAYAPFITYGRVSSTVVGSARRGDDVRVRLVDRDGDVRGVAHGGMPTVFQFFEAAFIDAGGADVYPMFGDRVVAPFTGDANLRVPRMGLSPDTKLDRVSGRCMPRSPYQLWVFYGEIAPVVRIGVTDAEGRFSRSVGIDMREGHFMTLNCRYATGDFVFMDQEI